jgi:hypothetical protein
MTFQTFSTVSADVYDPRPNSQYAVAYYIWGSLRKRDRLVNDAAFKCIVGSYYVIVK